MTDQSGKYLSDILSAIELIEDFTKSISSFENYLSDFKTQSAVERQLAIIGEAAKKYESVEPENHLENSKSIIGLRNRLIHSYDNLDPTIIWAILKRHLSELKKEVVRKLEEK